MNFDPDHPVSKVFGGGLKRSDFPSTIFLRGDFDRMSQPSHQGDCLHPDASNLSAVLASLKLNNPEKFDEIEATLRSIISQIVRIRFQQVPMYDLQVVSNKDSRFTPEFVSGFQLLFDTSQIVGVPADAASEGTLLTLAIVTAIVVHEDEFEHVMLIDDLDASLHPAAQERLIAAIRKLLIAQPALQIIATSHSPYLLHSLDFDEVRLTTLRDDGTVACGKLTDHPDFDRWKDEMTPGEMWGMFGERWLVDSPQAEATA